ncbi:hypothetical protein GOP47_0017741 [Adiantum capillus-veneris]|uniref:Uncharacterized protein n=1 Tax=Adiantum capillus-veneris TaxID=13818 RepID=A0A9D4UFY1_ADICA|nr:hypothetical protein GOP47_0017741 [Adiantum capillus-veneris]
MASFQIGLMRIAFEGILKSIRDFREDDAEVSDSLIMFFDAASLYEWTGFLIELNSIVNRATQKLIDAMYRVAAESGQLS